MTADPPIHPTEVLTDPSGAAVNVDTEMVPVVRQVWRLGLATTACCQDVGEATSALRALADGPSSGDAEGFIAFYQGYALLKMPRDDTLCLAGMLLDTPFRNHIKQRWQPGSWRLHVPVVYEQDTVVMAETALIHFPRDQIPALAETLANL